MASRPGLAQGQRLPPIVARGSEVTVSRTLIVARPDLPVATDPGLLFYVQHSINKSLIVYAARLRPDGKLDPNQPVEAFWRRFDEQGQRRALNFFERIFAFGVSTRALPDGRYGARIAGYRAREAIIDLDERGKPRALLPVGSRMVRVVYAYASADDAGFIPKIHYVDVHGFDIATGEAIRERIRLDM
ncbi:DUF4833 domain-containing protein [Phreatobacter stygius]|nr:DUF4833 domain-containing protein [Phreatobacter stygius]